MRARHTPPSHNLHALPKLPVCPLPPRLNISRRPISFLWLILALDSTTQPVVSIKPDVITPFEAGFEKGKPCLLCCPEDRLAQCVAVPVIELPFQREMAMGIMALVLAQREGGNERPPRAMMLLK
jgi:hypothetical protein